MSNSRWLSTYFEEEEEEEEEEEAVTADAISPSSSLGGSGAR